MKIRITALSLVAALLLLTAGCAAKAPASSPSDSASPSPSSTAITVTDMKERTVTLDKPAEKVVILTAGDCEILYALGAGSTLIGRGEYCDYPAEVSNVTAVASGSKTNIEQIISLKPDVVIMGTMDQTTAQVSALENAGIKVVVTDPQNIDGVYTDITLIGALVGKSDAAKTVIDSMKKTFDDIKTKVAADNGSKAGKTIYFEVSPLQYGLYAAGSGTFMDEIATMLGLKNIFADQSLWPQVSEEQVIAKNPDYIVTTAMSYEGSPNPVDEISSRAGWDKIAAVKDGQVYNADSNAIMRPGPRLADAALDLYNFVYGTSASASSAPAVSAQ